MRDLVTSARIDLTVENICRQGCEHVRQVIDWLQAGDISAVGELQDTSDGPLVLTELCAIMAVYDRTGGSFCPVPGFSDIKKAST
jgi:hypothetical protein